MYNFLFRKLEDLHTGVLVLPEKVSSMYISKNLEKNLQIWKDMSFDFIHVAGGDPWERRHQPGHGHDQHPQVKEFWQPSWLQVSKYQNRRTAVPQT